MTGVETDDYLSLRGALTNECGRDFRTQRQNIATPLFLNTYIFSLSFLPSCPLALIMPPNHNRLALLANRINIPGVGLTGWRCAGGPEIGNQS
jgi:hypothetical protein